MSKKLQPNRQKQGKKLIGPKMQKIRENNKREMPKKLPKSEKLQETQKEMRAKNYEKSRKITSEKFGKQEKNSINAEK